METTRTVSCYHAAQTLLVTLLLLDHESTNCDTCTEQTLLLRISYAAVAYCLGYIVFECVAWQPLSAIVLTISSGLWSMVAYDALMVRSIWFGLCSLLVALLSVATPMYLWLDMMFGMHFIAFGTIELLLLASHYLLPMILLAGFMGDNVMMLCCNNSRPAIRVTGDTGDEAIHRPGADGIHRDVTMLKRIG